MKIFKQILSDIKNKNKTDLHKYNQFFIYKFFEYAFNDKEFLKLIINKQAKLILTQQYCPYMEKVMIIACNQSLTTLEHKFTYFQYLYNEYLTMKSTKLGWRGRTEWFDFHKTILTQFIWSDSINKFIWTFNNLKSYLTNFKQKYPNVSDWRRKWYISEFYKIKIYITKIIFVSNKIEFFQTIFQNNIITNTKPIQNILIKYGYIVDSPSNNIVKATFTKYKEWKWIISNQTKFNKNKLDIRFCFKILFITNHFHTKIFNIFKQYHPNFFWRLFIEYKLNDNTFYDNKYLIHLLKDNYFNLKDTQIKNDVIHTIFYKRHLFKNKNIISYISKRIKHYKLTIAQFIPIFIQIYNTQQQKDSDFEYLIPFCKSFVKYKRCMSFKIEITPTQMYWLYVFFNDKIQPFINNQIKQKYKINTHLTQECAICYEQIKDNNNNNYNNTMLICGHIFHKSCIKEDLRYNYRQNYTYKCPYCRTPSHINLITNI
tara:strand:- start:2296 stop:3750 length:1455 start_codon:yes stop_codon:yes gene_type:complete